MLKEINSIFIVLFCIALLIITGVVFLFITFNNKKNKLIQDKLKTALNHQQKMHGLELNALRAQMNPHFVHNSLNAILYYIQKNDVETSENYLARFSKLMRQFFDYSRQQSITIKDEISLLKNYLYIEKLRFEEKINYSIKIDPNLDIDDEEIPVMILQPIVENAINHGLFHKKGNGNISIEFSKANDESFKVTIIDNGIGINNSLKNKKTIISDKHSHSSSVIKERLTLLKESNHWDIIYNIEDRSINKGLTGTEVTLVFK